jgi:hypothetical protein
MNCPLGRDVNAACPRKTCEACHADLDERAAHVAHHLGAGVPPLSREASMRLAVAQAHAALPGQSSLL